MRILALLFVSIIFFSCSKSTGIKELVVGSDSVAINFFKGDGSMDTVYKVVILRDKKQVDNLAAFIESSTTKDFKCGYDGSLHFFKNNVVLKDIDFRMNADSCMYFSFMLKGYQYTTTLSEDAKRFLLSVRK